MFNGKKEAEMNTALDVRESLKKKMIAAGSHQMIEVTAPELSFIIHGDLDSLIKEVEQICAQEKSDVIDKHEDMSRRHKEHLDRIFGGQDAAAPVAREVTFEEVVKPLIKWLADNHCPHKHVVVTSTSAELFGGLKSFNTFEYLKD